MAVGKPHLRVERFLSTTDYARPKGGGGQRRDYGRAYEQHAESLKQEIASAWADADALIGARDAPVGEPGVYLAFATAREAPLPNLEWRSQGIRLASARRAPDGEVEGAVFVPDAARAFLADKLTAYGADAGGGRQTNEDRFAAIERFSAARLETLWVDRRPVPVGPAPVWWECWCWPDRVDHLVAKAQALNVSVSDERLRFHEREVVFVHAPQALLARLVSSTDAVAELRSGRDTAAFFMGEPRADQDGWVSAMAGKLADERSASPPAVCLLDTGVNRAHPLLEPFLAPADQHAVQTEWQTDDHDGHGTELAGLALYGDLVGPIQSDAPVPVTIALESVKVMPPGGFPANAPSSLGLVTLQAVARPEISQPARDRVFCLALGQDDVVGPRASSWSAAIDQAAYGSEDEETTRRRRLFVVAAGNVPDGLKLADMEDRDAYEVEDPAQAWNALSVGGVTEKAAIAEDGHGGWTTAAQVDELSPYSKVSAAWNRAVAPVKPDLVMEAGNRGVDPADESLWSGIGSLSLLTTGRDVLAAPLSTTWATSAATALVAGMGARLLADAPDLWPETVRALLVHSARWTPPMQALVTSTPQKGERMKLARRFGYGRPNLDRAHRSSASALALVSQARLQPYRRVKQQVRLNALHLYELPWPKAGLAQLAEKDVRLRVTLSYFVDPNPSADAPLAPARYRSFGLRFDLRKKGESVAAFQSRLNERAEAPDGDLDLAEDDTARLFGARSVSAGSLHVEEWSCSAADLIERDTLAIFPVGGWWKTSRDTAVSDQLARYSLVVTLDAGDVDVDLYSEIEGLIEAKVAAAAVPLDAS